MNNLDLNRTQPRDTKIATDGEFAGLCGQLLFYRCIAHFRSLATQFIPSS